MTHADVGAVEAFFAGGAAEYDRLYDANTAAGRTLRARARIALELLGDRPGAVLDAGMGAGRLCAELDRRGWTVSGIDVTPRMVELAVERLPHLRGRLVQGSITALPFPAASFDAVVTTGVLEYTAPALPRALSEVARVLRPGGTAVVSVPNYRAPMVIWRARVLYPLVRLARRRRPTGPPPPPRLPALSFDSVCRQLAEAGLMPLDARAVGPQPLPARLSDTVERSRPRLAWILGMQRVVRARATS